MADCDVLERCPFFNDHMKNMPEHAELFKHLYCHGGNDICARYMVFKKLGRESVPQDMFPNEVTRASTILATCDKPAKKA